MAGTKEGVGGIYNRNNSNLYHYSNNNPITYTDPDGRKINGILSRQFQNSEENKYQFAGNKGTYDLKTKKANDIGNYGCLFTCFVNIGNTYNKKHKLFYKEQSVAELAKEAKYFSHKITGYGKRFQNGSYDMTFADFVSSTAQLETLLKDMTGVNFSVTSISDKDQAIQKAKEFANGTTDAYLVGKIPQRVNKNESHFVNILSYDDKRKQFEVFDPYARNGEGATYYVNENKLRGIYYAQVNE